MQLTLLFDYLVNYIVNESTEYEKNNTTRIGLDIHQQNATMRSHFAILISFRFQLTVYLNLALHTTLFGLRNQMMSEKRYEQCEMKAEKIIKTVQRWLEFRIRERTQEILSTGMMMKCVQLR